MCRVCSRREKILCVLLVTVTYSDWMTKNEETFVGRSRNRTIENLHEDLGRGSDSQKRRTCGLSGAEFDTHMHAFTLQLT